MILRNVSRAVANALHAAVALQNSDVWDKLRCFTRHLTQWHQAVVEQQHADQLRSCATTMCRIMHQVHDVCSHAEWQSFIFYLDQLLLVGPHGTLLSLYLLSCIVRHSVVPNINLSMLGISHVLRTTKTYDVGYIVRAILESSDNFDIRRPAPNHVSEDVLHMAQLFLHLFCLDMYLQKELLFKVLWTLQTPMFEERANHFPILHIPAEQTNPPRKKDFLVYLSPACVALIIIPPYYMQVYKSAWITRFWWYRKASILWKFLCKIHLARTLWCMMSSACKMLRLHKAMRIIYICVGAKHRGESFITNAREQTATRRHEKKIRRRATKLHARNARERAHKDQLIQKVHVIVGMRVALQRLVMRARKRVCAIQESRRALQHVVHQKELNVYMQSSAGRKSLHQFHMLRCLLKQLLRIVVQCLQHFNNLVNDRTQCHNTYVSLYSFGVEPFLFSRQIAREFANCPTVAEFVRITKDLCKRKFSTRLFVWLSRHDELKSYVGCVGIFEYVASLFVEIHNHILRIPDNMLVSTAFVRFTIEDLDRTTSDAFCKKYADLALTWHFDAECLHNIVDAWLSQGKCNYDLLDMLKQIHTISLNLEDDSSNHVQMDDALSNKTRRVMVRVKPKNKKK